MSVSVPNTSFHVDSVFILITTISEQNFTHILTVSCGWHIEWLVLKIQFVVSEKEEEEEEEEEEESDLFSD